MKHRLFYFLLLLVSITSILFYYYSPVLTHANDYIFSDQGDGIKSYYSMVYHIKHDPSFIEFKGMNYPYHEHFFYTDGHPLFSGIIKFLSKIFPEVINYSVGIINWLMIISIALTAIIMYLIFLHFKIPYLWSIISALIITFLSPQIFRMLGHFALSFSFIIPLIWYCFIRFRNSNNKLKWSLIISVVSFLFFFIHAYLGLIVVLFILIAGLIDIAFDFKTRGKKAVNWFYFFLQALLPVIIFQTFMILTDTHTDRSNDPWGIWAYMANPNSVFLPNQGKVRDFINGFVEIGHQKWEGWAYIGIISTSIFAFLIIQIIIKLIQRKQSSLQSIFSKEWIIFLIASMILLLYSFGVPYNTGMSFLLDWFPTLKQFRSLGRFAWVFYFVFTSFSLYYIYLLSEKIKYKFISYSMLLLIASFYLYESLPYHKNVSESIVKTANYFKSEHIPNEIETCLDHIDPNEFQAILPLPFFHGHSGDFGRPHTYETLKQTCLLSFYSSLPTIASNTSRTSVCESRRIVQLVSPPYYKKEIRNDFKKKKPFLILYTKENLTENEQLILKRSEKFYENDKIALYKLNFDQLFKSNQEQIIDQFESAKDSLYFSGDYYLSDSTSFFIHKDFEENDTEISYRGKAGKTGLRKDLHFLVQLEENVLTPNTEYTISLWFYNKGYSRTHSVIRVEEQSPDKTDWIAESRALNSEIIDGYWSLVKFDFKTSEKICNYNIFVAGDRRSRDIFYLDEFLLKQKNLDVYKVFKSKDRNELFKNGLFIPYQ
jgi:hypothetical protein